MSASYFQPSQNTASKAESNPALPRLMLVVQMSDSLRRTTGLESKLSARVCCRFHHLLPDTHGDHVG
jgi:hypothetical protein